MYCIGALELGRKLVPSLVPRNVWRVILSQAMSNASQFVWSPFSVASMVVMAQAINHWYFPPWRCSYVRLQLRYDKGKVVVMNVNVIAECILTDLGV